MTYEKLGDPISIYCIYSPYENSLAIGRHLLYRKAFSTLGKASVYFVQSSKSPLNLPSYSVASSQNFCMYGATLCISKLP